jgi:hypothetical protein
VRSGGVGRRFQFTLAFAKRTMIRFLICDSVTTASALFAMAFAWFGEGILPTVIALLLVLNLLAGLF